MPYHPGSMEDEFQKLMRVGSKSKPQRDWATIILYLGTAVALLIAGAILAHHPFWS